jgi:hypothetical protein
MADGTADDPGTEAAPGGELVTCEWCGRQRPAGGCGCAAEGKGGEGGRAVPEGWDPALTRTDRPRLKLTGRPE